MILTPDGYEVDYQMDDVPPGVFRSRPRDNSRTEEQTLCSVIQNILPKSANDGKFVLIGPDDQASATDNHIPISIPPPKGFYPKLDPRLKIPKLKVPKIKVPKFKVPTLKSVGSASAPRLGAPMNFPSLYKARVRDEEESSAERMEKFKKGVQKMLHVVKVLGQIDQYLSERTRIIVDILSKTITERD
ncbi:uncharacterized protein LOC126376380 [Pectinophora gossypiella]|uniref:uncharacterized protein LOC126376380 n=1 Tax=Pectinophora gossypiella TaxID=13191 RepID=UPI00214E1E01|nr:uncharacterized protein LOC126376380 [Pectinophora gossypiella]